MADAEERVVLAGQDAIDLWRQGRDAWNAWIAKNPEADINFSGVDFSKYGDVSFAGFRFPEGKKDFFETIFGDGDVSFFGATLAKALSTSSTRRSASAMSASSTRHSAKVM